MLDIRVVRSLELVEAEAWNALAGSQPFVRHEFLLALEQTGCVGQGTGWDPLHLLLWRDDVLIGAMPLYVKHHSRGEFVFDHGWAHAYARHGLAWYPKLLCAVPFTPVSGQRLLAHTPEDRQLLALAAIELARDSDVSSLHINFPLVADLPLLQASGYQLREGVQFHWHNRGYTTLDDFLACLTHDKRKKLRQDSRRVAEAGITFRALRGTAIGPDELDFLYHCYCTTYAEHGSVPYLTRALFERWHRVQPDALLLVQACDASGPVACALNVVDGATVYGRYWGTTRFVSGLHFETCYVQTLRWCIEQGMRCFEGGAQGEHKMARGLLPVPTWSAHWIANQDFAAAIGDFLQREQQGVAAWLEEMDHHTPFRHVSPEGDAQ